MIKNNPLINLFYNMWKYSIGAKKKVITFIILSLIANGIYLLEPIIIGRVFNSVQFSQNDPNLLQYIIKNLLLLIAITIGFWIFHGTSRVIETKNAFLVRKNYKQDMFDKVMELPAQWHKNHHSGDTIDKINKASENLYYFSDQIFLITSNFINLFGSIIILAVFDWRSTIIAVSIAMLAIWTIFKFDKILIRYYKKIFKAENFLASAIHDYISNIITIITLRLKRRVSREIERRSMRHFKIYKKESALNEIKWFAASFYISIMTAGVLILNARTSYKTEGVIIIGTLFILYKYLHTIGNVFYNFAWQYGEMVKYDTAIKEMEIINREHKKLKAQKKYYLPKNWNTLQIKNLFFAYKNKGDADYRGYDINSATYTVSKNEKIALIGESGSGKSTILTLMRGLHEAKNVKVYCDGKKLPHGLAHFYEHVLLIPQDPEIFNSTIEDNITMDTKVSKEELRDAIELARFDMVVARLKKGLKTNIMEKGVSLSGGEKQRLALARGLLIAKNYDFLFLDEPTSSVDSDNELQIYKNVFAKYSDKTIVSSIHRLHLLYYFDYIYYFKNGKIQTEGTFTTMLTDPNFKKLWENYTRHHAVFE